MDRSTIRIGPPGGALPESPVDRGREGEAYLCQFPDRRCDMERTEGTGYCTLHIGIMRGRAVGNSRIPEHAAELESQLAKYGPPVVSIEEEWARALGETSPADAFASEVQ